MTRNASVALRVACANEAVFLKIDPKSAVPDGKVEAVACAVPQATSVVVGAPAARPQTMSLRVKMRRLFERE